MCEIVINNTTVLEHGIHCQYQYVKEADKRADNTLHSNHLRPCLTCNTGSFAENDRVIGRGDVEGCRAGVGAERFAVLVGVFIEGVEVLAVSNNRPVLEGERSVRMEFLSGLRSLKCCRGKSDIIKASFKTIHIPALLSRN